MGKDLRGRELGRGIAQRKDGKYTARFVNRDGKRVQKYFDKLSECRQWLADAVFQDEHGGVAAGEDMTVDAWQEYWMTNLKTSIRESTRSLHERIYRKNIKDCIGRMTLLDVKPLHCQNVLNNMSSIYRIGTIRIARNIMHSMFESAIENDLILKNPVTKQVKAFSSIEEKTSKVLTVVEQKTFVDALLEIDKTNARVCRFALQTGMRSGEIAGLKWGDIDFPGKRLIVKRTIHKSDESKWVVSDPKTKSGIRSIPLTDEAIRVLKEQKSIDSNLSKISMEFHDNVFLLETEGVPACTQTLDKWITRLCKKLEITHISMHSLRHTFATRCAEAGMQPKVLQKILGHSDISMTLNLYVHATEEAKAEGMKGIESALNVEYLVV